MKYCLINSTPDSPNYTASVLKKLIKINGHELTTAENSDIILVSLCDITEIKILKKARETYKSKFIICGGCISVFYKVLALFADAVTVGQGFEFFELQTKDEIIKAPFVYTKGKKEVYPSTRIDWGIVPAVQLTSNTFYYWGAVGCKNKCSFCLTSWTNKEQHNDPKRIKAMQTKIKNVKIISNEEETSLTIKENVKDLMLKTFLNAEYVNTKLVRIGLEFATEKTRKENGKFFTDEEILKAIEKAEKHKTELQFFCISGLNTKKEWLDLFEKIPVQYLARPRVFFKFTNLEYQMHTPLYKKRKEMNLDNYLDNDFNNLIIENYSGKLSRLRTFPIKFPAHALWRQGVSTSVSTEQFNEFWELRNSKDLNLMYKTLYSSGVIENDYSNELKLWWKK